MKDIKKTASLKSKVKGKETQFKIDLDYSPEYDSFNIKVKKGEGFMSYTDALQGLPLDVVQNINEMLEEILIKAGSEGETKEYDNDYADIGQFSLSDSEWNKTEKEYIDLGKKIVKTKFNGDLGKAYNYVVRKKREFGGDFQAGVYASGGSLEAHGIKEGDTFVRSISGGIQKVKDKDGKIVYINLANGERDLQPPLPFKNGGGIGIEEKIDLTDDKRLRLRKPVMPKRKLTQQEWAEKHNPRAYEYMGKTKMATGGALVGNQKRIDLNKNGKIDAEDFKLLRSSMNGAWRNDHKHVNHDEDYEVRYAKPRPHRKGYKGKRKFGEGGGISNFERLSRVVAKNYEGKRVKPKYQKEYGKTYSKSEAKEVGNKVAGKVKMMKKAESGTAVAKGNRGGVMVLAKKIRKDGESWKDALKRAGEQMK